MDTKGSDPFAGLVVTGQALSSNSGANPASVAVASASSDAKSALSGVASVSSASASASALASGSSGSSRLPYYSSDEVSTHISSADCWVSYFGRVYNLTPLIEQHKGVLVQPILKFAGTDITHWFDEKTKEPKTYIDPVLNVRMPYCPHGRYVHIPPPEPSADWNTDFGVAWWADTARYCVGHLSRAKRTIRVVNTLTGQDDRLEVCAEETLNDIKNRYLRLNAHANSYTWKALGRPLNMAKTLEENGIADESAEFAALRLDETEFVPVLHVYFNDDLTVG